MLGAADDEEEVEAGAGVEPLLPAPNKLGVGVADDEVVVLGGLLAMKEKAGFEAEVESAAFCPKLKVSFGASEVDVSLFSAGFPNVKAGGGCSVEALGFPKGKPPEGTGAGSGSFFAAPKMKVDGAASFFFSSSSGLPKVNVGAAGSLPACKDPKVELACCVLDARFGSPSLPNTDPLGVAVVVGLVLVDAVSFDDTALSLFSSEEERGVTEDEDVVVVDSVFFSAGLGSPKVKPLLEEELLSVLDDSLLKATPLLPPNLNSAPVAGWSDFLSSLDTAPNLKPSEEPPNLNPDEEVVSLEEDSEEELPKGAPNLNPLDDDDVDDDNSEVPNLKPPEPVVLSEVPNLNPPGLEVEEPNVEVPEVTAAEEPKDPKALVSTLAPGLVF